jgi:hypothetical protein
MTSFTGRFDAARDKILLFTRIHSHVLTAVAW